MAAVGMLVFENPVQGMRVCARLAIDLSYLITLFYNIS
jgi:hypothetical protein